MWWNWLQNFRFYVTVPLTMKILKQCERRSSHRRCFVKKVFLEISQNSQENACARESLFYWSCRFSCEFCKISKNTFLTEHLWATASASCSFNVSRFYRLCSQARFITKRKEIVKSVYLNLGIDKVEGLPGFHTFSGANIKWFFLSKRKKKCWQFLKKEAEVLIIHLRLLVQATTSLLQLTNETIARV